MVEENSNFINTLIGTGSYAEGQFKIKGFFRIDGDFNGIVTTEGRVLVSSSGRMKGEIHSSDVVIGGVFKGDLYAEERVVLLSSALVIGNIYSPRLEMDLGALLEGYACITPRIREEGPQPVRHQDTYTIKIDRTRRIESPLNYNYPGTL